MGDDGRREALGALVASVVAHVLGAAFLVLLPMAIPPSPRAALEQEFTIIVEEGEPEPEPLVEEAEPEPVIPEPEPETEAPRPRDLAPDTAALLPSTTTDPTTAITPEATTTETPTSPTEEPRIEETDAQRRERLRILLDPAAVARGSFQIDTGAGPGQRRGPQTGVTADVGPGTMTEAEAEAAHSGHLRAQAMARPWLSRTPLTARARPDGTFVYAGHAFTATIEPDGSVRYDDRPGVQTEGFSTSGSFDLGDMFMRAAGGDPYAAERLRFEEDNEELIARLDREHRAQAMTSALGRLPGQLERIWQRTAWTPERRRRAIFAMWEETDEGEAGLGARRAIEAWVREHLPAGEADAFTPDEIRALNATHAHPYRFNPYR